MLDEFEILVLLHLAEIGVLCLGILYLRSVIVSKSAELAQAVTDLTTAVNNAVSHGSGLNTTPDADVDTAITGINAAKDALNTAFPAQS